MVGMKGPIRLPLSVELQEKETTHLNWSDHDSALFRVTAQTGLTKLRRLARNDRRGTGRELAVGLIVLAVFVGVSLVAGAPALAAGLALALGKNKTVKMRTVGWVLAVFGAAPIAFTLLLTYGLLFLSN